MITQLRLRHWKSHELTEVSFGKGTNLLVGAMGSGKSSLMESVCFALFGTFPSLKSKRVKLAEVVMQRPTKYDEASVELWFEAGGASYSVERQIKAGAASAFLRAGGKMMESGSERVTEVVQKILRADYELFTRAVYSEQNRVDYFLTLGKGERKKQIDELLGIARLEVARANAASLANKLKAMKQAEEGFLQGMDWQKVEAELSQTEDAAKALEKSIADWKKKSGEKNQELTDSLKAVKNLEHKEREHNEFSKQLAAAESVITSTKQIADAIAKQLSRQYGQQEITAEKTSAENALRQLEDAEKQLLDARASRDKATGEKAAFEKRTAELKEFSGLAYEKIVEEEGRVLSVLEQTRNKARKAVAALSADRQRASDLQKELVQALEAEKQLADCSQQLLELRQTAQVMGAESQLKVQEKQLTEALAAAHARSEELQKTASALEGAQANCPVCGQSLDEEHKKEFLSEKTAEAQKLGWQTQLLKQQLADAQKKTTEAASLAKKLAEFEQKTSFLQPLAARKTSFEAEIRALAQRASELERQAQAEEKTAAEAEAGAKQLQLQAAGTRELEAARKQLAELDAKTKLVEQVVAKLSQAYSEERKKALENKLRELEKAGELSLLLQKISDENKKKTELENKLRALSFNSSELAQAREKLLSLERETASIANELKAGEQRLAEKTSLLNELRQKREAAKQRLEKVRKLEKKTIGVMKFQEALAETQALLRGELVQSINEALAELWKTIYPYGDYPAARLSANEDDYELSLQTLDGEWTSVESASGGEKTSAALSLRIAFAVVLAPGLSWLILDEPTHNLDAAGVQSLARALRDQVPQIVQQTFVITHDEALREAANAKVYRIERDKDDGDKSTVEELAYN